MCWFSEFYQVKKKSQSAFACKEYFWKLLSYHMELTYPAFLGRPTWYPHLAEWVPLQNDLKESWSRWVKEIPCGYASCLQANPRICSSSSTCILNIKPVQAACFLLRGWINVFNYVSVFMEPGLLLEVESHLLTSLFSVPHEVPTAQIQFFPPSSHGLDLVFKL